MSYFNCSSYNIYYNKEHLRSVRNIFIDYEMFLMIMNLFQPEKDPEPGDTNFQTKLSSHHLKIKVPSSYQRSVLESNAGKSVAEVLLPQPLEPALVSTGLLLIF